MSFKLWQIDDYVRFQNLARNEVSVTARSVGLRHKAWIVTSDTKRRILIRNRFQQTLTCKVKQYELIFRLYILLCDPYTVNKHRYRPTEIANTYEPRVTVHEVTRPSIQSCVFQERCEIAALQWRIANQNLRGASAQNGFSSMLH